MSDSNTAPGGVRGTMNHLFLNLLSLLFLGVGTSPVLAAAIDITAMFKPDPTNPANNTFVNTTPISGYCVRFTAECRRAGISSLIIPITTSSTATIIAEHTDPRRGAMIKAPAEWRDLSITHAPTGDVKVVKVRIAGLGAYQRFTETVQAITGINDLFAAHQALWQNGRWNYARPPCGSTANGEVGDKTYGFFWLTPSSSACSRQALFDIPGFHYNTINIAYQLNTPNPFDMQAGFYAGSITYTVGPGGDFDFGDVVIPNDSVLTFNFSLSVEHILTIKFPQGADRLTLVPDGGWQQWLQRGRRPEKLFANQSFQMWTSTTFKMLLQCQYPVGDQCGIQNGAGDLVPVETRVTLPTGIVALTGMSVNSHPLSNSNASVFHPSEYIENGSAALHFEVSRDSLVQMTNHEGSRYSGNVTIVFDSEI